MFMCRWMSYVPLLNSIYAMSLGHRLPRLLFEALANTTSSNNPHTFHTTSMMKHTQTITTMKRILTTPKTLPVATVTSHAAMAYSTRLSQTRLSHHTMSTIPTKASTITHPPLTPSSTRTTRGVPTLSICDYLCSIQMGGAACSCSVPLVPGKK